MRFWAERVQDVSSDRAGWASRPSRATVTRRSFPNDHSAAATQVASTVPGPWGNICSYRDLVLRISVARSMMSVRAAPKTGGSSSTSSQHGGLLRPAASGGSTPNRRYSSA